MFCKSLVLSLVVGCAVSCVCWADECEPCRYCSGDPVFVQRDGRRPEVVLLLRHLGVKKTANHRLEMVAFFSDQKCCDESSQTVHSAVIIWDDGARDTIEITRELARKLAAVGSRR